MKNKLYVSHSPPQCKIVDGSFKIIKEHNEKGF